MLSNAARAAARPPLRPSRGLLSGLAAVALLLFSTASFATVGFVGAERCATCHEAAFEAWRGSHHDLAMDHATEQTVLGDFEGAEYTYAGVTSRFFRRDGKFFVNTDGPDGALADFEITHTFGVYPLQQYLVPFPDGRMQALGIAWDTRPAAEGGQRWFHLYPGERVTHEDELHWTGAQQNWNYMCADCHSTNLRKNYSPAKDVYRTTWSEIDVACEACHGPGQAHVAWAEGGADETTANYALAFALDERDGVSWAMNPRTGNAARSEPNTARREIEVCATCHSRRGIMREGAATEASFLDHYMPSLLVDGLYHADGQILDEVYVWGSFTQSKMHAAGVTCSDCHEPHSQALRAPGDAVCAQCHLPTKFAAASHHGHPEASEGARCANCHMPETTYMVVDPRRDHAMRIPRPDLTLAIGTPNACNGCHADQDATWAQARLVEWHGERTQHYQDWAEAFAAARSGEPSAGTRLAALATDSAKPAIVRATATQELAAYLSPQTGPALQAAFSDPSPLVRLAAVRAVEALPVPDRARFVAPLLLDDHRAVRVEAGRSLAGAPLQTAGAIEGDPLGEAIAEYEAWQRLNADRAEAHLNLGNLEAQRGDATGAEKAFRTALRRDAGFVPAYVNLADLYRSQGLEAEAMKVLDAGIEANPDAGALRHARGLARVRAGRLDEALEDLARAAEAEPGATRYAYVYAVALHSAGRGREAVGVLEGAQRDTPRNAELLFALATINRDLGEREAALRWARQLLLLRPDDPGARDLVDSLGGAP